MADNFLTKTAQGTVSALTGGLGRITDARKFLDEQVNAFILKPTTAQGIDGFVFSMSDTERVEQRADITDYVVEDNTSVNDHIAIKPLTMTLRGYVGELVYESNPTGVAKLLSTVEKKLTTVASYFPTLTSTGLQAFTNALSTAQATITGIDKLVNDTWNLMSVLGITSAGTTKQQQAYIKLSSAFRTRQVMCVDSPWGTLQNMAISNITFEQDNKQQLYSDITVTLKQMTFSQTGREAPTANDIYSIQTVGGIIKGPVPGVTQTETNDAVVNSNSTLQKGIMQNMRTPGAASLSLRSS